MDKARDAQKITVISDVDREYLAAENIKILQDNSPGYPAILRDIYDPPRMLFCKGEISTDDEIAVAIVGARRCSLYGLRIAEKLAYDLAERGITVISGMAKGIDSAAHKGALKAGGRTIAVMGSGFRHIYPPGSEGLMEKISASGAVLTEFAPEVMPSKWTFPRRNRIISGMAQGVVVVEAAVKSGALLTVDFALQQGKDVFAVPGPIDMITSSGTNSLIKSGAKAVTDVNDILEELRPLWTGHSPKRMDPTRSDPKEKEKEPSISEAERAVRDIILRNGPMRIDVLADLSDMRPGVLSEVLLNLETKRKIKALPGKRYECR
ncbi:MAG: DNA-processing protein DprA [Candidatus Omnitrophota bacterium]|nr:DNA-processing protein DprA [Candidatus Omnitrophota bacterium]